MDPCYGVCSSCGALNLMRFRVALGEPAADCPGNPLRTQVACDQIHTPFSEGLMHCTRFGGLGCLTIALLVHVAPLVSAQVVSRTFAQEPTGLSSVTFATAKGGIDRARANSLSQLFDWLAFAGSNREHVRSMIRVLSGTPALVEAFEMTPRTDSLIQSARLALSTLDAGSSNYIIDGMPEPEREPGRAALRLFGDLLIGLQPSGGGTVQVFAAGAIRGAASSPDTASIRTGSLGIRVEYPRRAVITAALSVASSVDTVSSDYGQAILLPLSGAALASGMIDMRVSRTELCAAKRMSNTGTAQFFARVRCLLPDHYFVGASATTWLIRDTAIVSPAPDGPTTLPIGRRVSNVMLSALWGTDIINRTVVGNSVAVTVEAGITWRGLNGDFAQSVDDSTRTRILGTRHTAFFGPAFSLQLSFGQLSGSLDYSMLNITGLNQGRGVVQGLTQGQLAAGFRVDVPILTGRF